MLKKILIIEDTEATIGVILYCLDKEGFEYEVVKTANKGIEFLTNTKYDALFVDWRIPVSNENLNRADEEGAIKLFDFLSNSMLNSNNLGIPFLVLSADIMSVDSSVFCNIKGYSGSISKLNNPMYITNQIIEYLNSWGHTNDKE